MNYIYKTYCLLLICLLFSDLAKSQSKSINLLLAESESLEFGSLGAVLVNDYLVFERNLAGVKSIWSYNTNTNELTSLNLTDATSLTSFRDYAVITATTNEVDSVYISDGTQAGSSVLVNGSPYIQVTEHALYVFLDGFWGSTLYRFDGHNLIEFGLAGSIIFQTYKNQNICEPDSERFSVQIITRNFQGGITGGQIRGNYTLNNNSTPGFGGQEGYHQYQVDNLLGKCFFSVTQLPYAGFEQYSLSLLVHDPDSRVTTNYNGNEFVKNLSSFTQLDNQLYAVETVYDEAFFKIHQLDPETLESIAAVELSVPNGITTPSFSLPVLASTGDALLFSHDGLLLFDKDLNPLPLNQSIFNSPFNITQEFDIYQFQEFTMLANKHIQPSDNGLVKQYPELAYFSNQRFNARFNSTQQIRLDHLNVNLSNQEVILTAYDFNTQKLGHYQINNQPKISQQINGNWYNNELNSQGFSISKGVRQDRSEYVFLTAYLFRDGQPLWLAGNVNLNNNSDTLTLDLYEFDGPQLFEPNQTANRSFFGQVELELISCHNLRAVIETDGQTYQLLLNRADNIYYKDWCQE